MGAAAPATVLHAGGCHCGRVRFEVTAPAEISVEECNCSICAKAGFLHLIVQKADFRLLRGEESLATYTFNTGTAKHVFCKSAESSHSTFRGPTRTGSASTRAASTRAR